MTQIYRVTASLMPGYIAYSLSSHSTDEDFVHEPIEDDEVDGAYLHVVEFDTEAHAKGYEQGIIHAGIDAEVEVLGSTVLVDWTKSPDNGVIRIGKRAEDDDETDPDAGLETYTVEAWWTVVQQTKLDIQAGSPAEALEKAKEIYNDGDWPYFNQRTVDNSDGPSQFTVWSEGMGRELLDDPTNDRVVHAAMQKELELLRAKLTIAEGALASIAAPPKGRTVEGAASIASLAFRDIASLIAAAAKKP